MLMMVKGENYLRFPLLTCSGDNVSDADNDDVNDGVNDGDCKVRMLAN